MRIHDEDKWPSRLRRLGIDGYFKNNQFILIPNYPGDDFGNLLLSNFGFTHRLIIDNKILTIFEEILENHSEDELNFNFIKDIHTSNYGLSNKIEQVSVKGDSDRTKIHTVEIGSNTLIEYKFDSQLQYIIKGINSIDATLDAIEKWFDVSGEEPISKFKFKKFDIISYKKEPGKEYIITDIKFKMVPEIHALEISKKHEYYKELGAKYIIKDHDSIVISRSEKLKTLIQS